MGVNGGMGSSAKSRRSPSVRVWPPALHSAAFAPPTFDNTQHTSPPRSCVEKFDGNIKMNLLLSIFISLLGVFLLYIKEIRGQI